jgi:hypothetical protein
MTAIISKAAAQRAAITLSLALSLSAAAQQTGPAPQPIAAPAPSAAPPAPATAAPPVLILPSEPTATPAQPAPAPAAPNTQNAATNDPPLATVHLKDGQTLRGRILSRDQGGLVLDLGGGARANVPKDQIDEVLEDRPGARPEWRPDANRTRYLYSPSGFMLHGGEVYFSQTELAFSSVNVGVTDFFTLGIGSAIPALFVPEGANFVVAAKVGGSIGDYVHVAGGTQVFVLPSTGSGGAVGFLFGTVTLGTPDAHIGVSVGPPFATSSNRTELGTALLSVSGNLRVANSLALVTENWFAPGFYTSGETPMINAFAVRVLGDHISVDLGLVHVTNAGFPVPWLDFTYNFH